MEAPSEVRGLRYFGASCTTRTASRIPRLGQAAADPEWSVAQRARDRPRRGVSVSQRHACVCGAAGKRRGHGRGAHRRRAPVVHSVADGTLAVAAALFVAALVTLGTIGWLGDAVSPRVFRLLTVAMSLTFLARAIGDFKYVGFSRRTSDSAFAYWDMRLYLAPVLVTAAAALVLAWSKLDRRRCQHLHPSDAPDRSPPHRQ